MRDGSNENCFRAPIGNILHRDHIWNIPVYQRHYAWEPDVSSKADPCHIFLEDLMEQVDKRLKNREEFIPPHYLSTIKVKFHRLSDDPSKSSIHDVVDGQQRLVTVYLTLLSLLSLIRREGLKCDNEVESINRCLFYSGGQSKLNPSNFDREDFYSVRDLAVEDIEPESKSIVLKAYMCLLEHITEKVNKQEDRAAAVCTILDAVLNGLDVTMVYLDKHDDERKIFESLNTTGNPLTTFDVVRNRVFSKASKEDVGKPELDAELFRSPNWKELESPFWYEKSDGGSKVGGWTHVEQLLLRTLTASMHQYIEQDKFKLLKHYKTFAKDIAKAEDEIKELVRYSKIYRHLDNPEESAEEFGDYGLFNYQIWKSRVWYPILFLASECPLPERKKITDLLESFVIRRSVSGLKTTEYTYIVANLSKHLKDGITYERLRNYLHGLQSDTSLFPGNETVYERSLTSNFYGGGQLSRYILHRINEDLQKYSEAKADIPKLQLDHIAPKGWYKSKEWKEAFPGKGEFEMAEKLNTLGNVTILSSGNNSVKSNRPWKEAKETYSNSPLEINRQLASHAAWRMEEIDQRRKDLVGHICRIWKEHLAD